MSLPRPLPDWGAAARHVYEHLVKVAPWSSTVVGACGAAERVYVACSGGADSLCLLLVAATRAARGELPPVAVVHFDHRARPGSTEDAAFVAEVAAALRLACYLGRRDGEGPASEAELREARHAWLREATGGRPTLLAHHRDDAVETLLMRLGRGSGINGLAAPKPVERLPGLTLLRPWLDVPKRSLCAALEAAGVPWREDPTNAEPGPLRNRLRLTAMPALETTFASGFSDGAARSHRLLREDAAALDAWAEACFHEANSSDMLTLPDAVPLAIRRRVWWLWCKVQGLDATFEAETVDAIVHAWHAHREGRWSAGDRRFVCLTANGGLAVETLSEGAVFTGAAYGVVPPFELWFPKGNVLRGQGVPLAAEDRERVLAGQIDPACEAWVAVDAHRADLRVRHWQRGDRFCPLNAPGARKLQDIFTDAHVPQELRHRLPVVCSGAEILWIPGLPPAHSARITPSTTEAMQLTYW